MEELIGFVTGNNNRQKLLSLLSSKKGMDSQSIAKNMHLFKPFVDKIIKELLDKKLIEEKQGKYNLTELGISLENMIHHI